MRIAQIAPLHESVPPLLYGGTERVVSYLTEELVAQGHDVTLFASGDSRTSARLEAVRPQAIRLDRACEDPLPSHIVLMERAFRRAEEFDIIHAHVDYVHFPLARRSPTPTVTTLHGRLDIADLIPLYQEFPDTPVVSISNNQRTPLPDARWAGTVYHGLPTDLYRFNETPSDYLAFLGRISPEKRVDRAIEIAKRTGMKLKISAKVSKTDQPYFEETIKPLLQHPLVEWIGEIGEAQKSSFLGNARALLFPIEWPEPFGLVMIEAMACGTPVIAYNRGSVPEVIDENITGFIVNDLEEAVAAVPKVLHLSRKRCRGQFEARFTAGRMAQDYLAIYERLIQTGHRHPHSQVSAASIGHG